MIVIYPYLLPVQCSRILCFHLSVARRSLSPPLKSFCPAGPSQMDPESLQSFRRRVPPHCVCLLQPAHQQNSGRLGQYHSEGFPAEETDCHS